MSNYCSNCGAMLQGGNFCASCGSSQGSNPSYGAPSAGPGSLSTSQSAAMWCHLGALLANVGTFVVLITGFLTWLPALIIRQRFPYDQFVQRHAVESLNFQIQLLILSVPMAILSVITCGLGLILVLAVFVYSIVLMIQASMAASRGQEFTYPFVFIRVVK